MAQTLSRGVFRGGGRGGRRVEGEGGREVEARPNTHTLADVHSAPAPAARGQAQSIINSARAEARSVKEVRGRCVSPSRPAPHSHTHAPRRSRARWRTTTRTRPSTCSPSSTSRRCSRSCSSRPPRCAAAAVAPPVPRWQGRLLRTPGLCRWRSCPTRWRSCRRRTPSASTRSCLAACREAQRQAVGDAIPACAALSLPEAGGWLGRVRRKERWGTEASHTTVAALLSQEDAEERGPLRHRLLNPSRSGVTTWAAGRARWLRSRDEGVVTPPQPARWCAWKGSLALILYAQVGAGSGGEGARKAVQPCTSSAVRGAPGCRRAAPRCTTVFQRMATTSSRRTSLSWRGQRRS